MTCQMCDLSIFTIGDPVTHVATIPQTMLKHRIASKPAATSGIHGDFSPIQADSYLFSFSTEGIPQEVERLGALWGAEVSFSGECPVCHSIYTGNGTLCCGDESRASAARRPSALRVDRCHMLVLRYGGTSSEGPFPVR